MYILNIARAIKSCQSMKMRDFQKCYKWIGFSKENSYYIKWNAWNPCNSIDHLQEKNNKLVITEHQKSSHKLSKTEKLGYPRLKTI